MGPRTTNRSPENREFRSNADPFKMQLPINRPSPEPERWRKTGRRETRAGDRSETRRASLNPQIGQLECPTPPHRSRQTHGDHIATCRSPCRGRQRSRARRVLPDVCPVSAESEPTEAVPAELVLGEPALPVRESLACQLPAASEVDLPVSCTPSSRPVMSVSPARTIRVARGADILRVGRRRRLGDARLLRVQSRRGLRGFAGRDNPRPVVVVHTDCRWPRSRAD